VTSTLVAGRVCHPGPPAPGWLLFDGPVIADVGAGRAPAGALDLGDAVLTPGFLDLQVNGVGAVDFVTASPDAWRTAARSLLAHGTTGYCPTVVTAPLDTYASFLDRLPGLPGEAEHCPTILGAHLEGPFLGSARGAHRADLVRRVNLSWLEHMLDAYDGRLALVTLAPEADPGLAAIRLLRSRRVVVALGHSTASYEHARAAADAGATAVTHLFNGMAQFHHREPGLAGAALDDDRLTPTLIADLVHVHPAALRLAIARKRNVALVTDAVAVDATLPHRDAPVHDDAGAVRLPDGGLVGSTLTMDVAVRNLVGLGVNLARAVEMATTVPAEVLGHNDRGRLRPGYRADVVALDVPSLSVRAVWLAGELAYGVLPFR
jgi:N-acetylglucosamine-6-phosphate deacetylase